MNEREVTEDQIREEHNSAVNQRNQALYMVAVIGGATILMLAFIALLGAGGA
jgi:hypothetical protein